MKGKRRETREGKAVDLKMLTYNLKTRGNFLKEMENT